MKKIALVAALAAVSASAFAQSTVTLYGRVNTTVESQKVANQDRKVVVANNSSRIGFKGTEDIGGGLKASFVLEHGFNADNGTASGAFWGRESSVQLSGGFGAVRLGNWTPGSYFATADYISMHNHDTGSSSDALYGGPFRSANKIAYFTPTVGGFNAEIAVAAGEGAPGVKRGVDLAANYVAGPVHLGAGYSKEGNNNQMAFRGLYEMGAVTLGAYFQRVDTNNVKRDIYRLAGMYAMGASEFHVNYGAADKTSLQAKESQFTLGYNYNLSKRTKVYGYYTSVDAKLANKAGDFSSLAAGVRHNF
ncbi:porin [Roseateles sp.]|jgi:predicted porin|uniref:porin n=1 Tax=Roseateles sp. TaxID=1971397 RepID=UPI0037CA7622